MLKHLWTLLSSNAKPVGSHPTATPTAPSVSSLETSWLVTHNEPAPPSLYARVERHSCGSPVTEDCIAALIQHVMTAYGRQLDRCDRIEKELASLQAYTAIVQVRDGRITNTISNQFSLQSLNDVQGRLDQIRAKCNEVNASIAEMTLDAKLAELLIELNPRLRLPVDAPVVVGSLRNIYRQAIPEIHAQLEAVLRKCANYQSHAKAVLQHHHAGVTR